MRLVPLTSLQQFAAVNLSDDLGNPGGKVQVPQAAQIVMNIAVEGGKTAHVVLYGRYSGVFQGSTAQVAALTTAFFTGAQWVALAAFLANTTTGPFISLRDVNVVDQPIIFGGNTGSNGTSASPALPSEVAAVISLGTAKAGKSFRGRAYIPGFATNALGTGNIIAGPVVTALNNWANTWGTAMSAQGYTHVLGLKHRIAYTSPKTGTNFPDRPATTEPVTSRVCKDNHWDSQRRRGLK